MKYLKLFSVAFILTFYVACSDVDLSVNYSQHTSEFVTGKVDILFVVDNSGSMSPEHMEIANRFSMYIETLDKSGLDYQIAMITTDISASPGNYVKKEANGWGAYQDGKLLEFGGVGGDVVLTKEDQDRVRLFQDLIQREETIECEDRGFDSSSCPSHDERGIYAAHLAVKNKEGGFFREDSHLAIVFISDEDERSVGGDKTDSSISSLPDVYLNLEEKDKPINLVKAISQHLGAEKSVTAYAIVVNPEEKEENGGEITCRTAQRNQGLLLEPKNDFFSGEYGTLYIQLANPSKQLRDSGNIMQGVVGDICAENYGKQLEDMADHVAKASNMIKLRCQPIKDPEPPFTNLEFQPALPEGTTYSIDDNNVLRFTPELKPGTRLSYTYSCPS